MSMSAWFVRQSSAHRQFRLYCFSYAGGSATTYMPWQAHLSPAVEVCAVQLPGRGQRLAEAPVKSWELLVTTVAREIALGNNLPFAFFGHSLGGLLAFEITRHCRRHGMPLPKHLFVSASNPPRLRPPSRRLHELDDDALVAALKEYNGTPLAAFENKELMELLLPAIRADFSLVADYQYFPEQALNIPISVFAGRQDKHVLSSRMLHWQEESTQECQLHWFDGDHFFIHSEQAALLNCLQEVLLENRYVPT